MGLARISVEEVRAAYRLEEYIARTYSGLKREGNNFAMICPFSDHDKNTASFKIHTRGQFYKCFGCGESGNIINFYAKINNVPWLEALRTLAEGVGIPVYTNPDEERQYQRTKKVMQAAVDFYHSYFHLVEEYICGDRGINEQSVKQFMVGFSPKSQYRNALLEHLLSEGFTIPEMRRQHLIMKKKEAPNDSENPRDYFDFFNGRIMFPIKGLYGYYVGFGSRITVEEEEELEAKGEKGIKYINSKTTKTPFGWPLFNKRNTVYGLVEGAHLKTEFGYPVEGYTDVILLQQKGIYALAAMGTSFTSGHARTIKKFVPNLINLQDPDEGGLKSLRRALPVQLKENLLPLAKFLPEGEDPAVFFQYRDDPVKDLENLPLIFPVQAIVMSHAQQKNYDPSKADFMERKKMFEDVFQDYISLLPERSNQFMFLHELAKHLDVPVSLAHAAFEDQLIEDMKYAASQEVLLSSETTQHSLTTRIISNLMKTTPEHALSKMKELPLTKPPFRPYQLNIIDALRDFYAEPGAQGFQVDSDLFELSDTATQISVNALTWLEDLYQRGILEQRAKKEVNAIKRFKEENLDDLVGLLHLEHTRFRIDQANAQLARAMANGDAGAANEALETIDRLSDDLDWT